jgi:hypothetical protein
MAKKYIPEFPYKGDQAIIVSGRIIFNSNDDSIFLFGKSAIGLSSLGEVNIDSIQGTTINSPIIQLGLNAKDSGEPLVKGYQNNLLLLRLLGALSELCISLSNISETNFHLNIPGIRSKAQVAVNTIKQIKGVLKVKGNLSKKTYTL